MHIWQSPSSSELLPVNVLIVSLCQNFPSFRLNTETGWGFSLKTQTKSSSILFTSTLISYFCLRLGLPNGHFPCTFLVTILHEFLDVSDEIYASNCPKRFGLTTKRSKTHKITFLDHTLSSEIPTKEDNDNYSMSTSYFLSSLSSFIFSFSFVMLPIT